MAPKKLCQISPKRDNQKAGGAHFSQNNNADRFQTRRRVRRPAARHENPISNKVHPVPKKCLRFLGLERRLASSGFSTTQRHYRYTSFSLGCISLDWQV